MGNKQFDLIWEINWDMIILIHFEPWAHFPWEREGFGKVSEVDGWGCA
jgi:hypothetical protein